MRERAPKILIVLLAVVWTVGLRAAIRWHGRSGASGDDDDDGAKKGSELVAMLPPIAPPTWTLTGADAARLDARWVIALIRAKRTRELGEALEAARRSFEQDPGKEPWLEALFEGLSFANTPELPALDAWVVSSPDSFAGYAARGAARLAVARRNKAEKPKNLSLARDDLERAIARAPRLIALHTLLFRSFVHEGVRVPKESFERAVAVCAACNGPRVEFIQSLRPGRGGTRQAMSDFAEESEPLVRENHRLRALPGYVELSDCADLASQGNYTQAHEACRRALAKYPTIDFLRQEALISYLEGDYEKAINGMSTLLTQNPYDVEALVERARGYTKLEDWKKAGADLRQALELEPSHEGGLTLYGWLFDKMERDVRFAARTGDLDELLEAYESAARIIPEYRAFRDARNAIVKRRGARPGGTAL
jgi:tetratricopeptide (TPR) repeat protein